MPVDPELIVSRGVEQPRSATDVQPLLGPEQVCEHRLQGSKELPLAGREARVLQLAPETARAHLQSGDALVQILACPFGEPGVNGVVERDDALRNTARGSDHNRHHRARVGAAAPRRAGRVVVSSGGAETSAS